MYNNLALKNKNINNLKVKFYEYIRSKNSNSLVFKMSVPIFIELLLQMLVGNIDQIMIGHFNEIYVGAIGNANLIINLIIIVLSVMSVSTTVLISRYLGSKEYR